MVGVLSVASSSGVVGDDNDAVSYASGGEGEWDGGEAAAATAATRNGDDAPPPAAAATAAAVVSRNGSKRQRLSGKFPSTVLVCCII
jgi:hypothetical protein